MSYARPGKASHAFAARLMRMIKALPQVRLASAPPHRSSRRNAAIHKLPSPLGSTGLLSFEAWPWLLRLARCGSLQVKPFRNGSVHGRRQTPRPWMHAAEETASRLFRSGGLCTCAFLPDEGAIADTKPPFISHHRLAVYGCLRAP